MNFKTTIILVVLLAGALAFYIAANWSGGDASTTDATTAAKRRDDDGDKGRKLLDVKPDDVRKLTVRPGDGAPAGSKPVELTQADGKWTIAQPINWPADSFEGRNFVDAVAGARSIGSVDLDPTNLASTGLDKPRYVVELADANNKVQKLAIGKQSALGHLYVQANDEKTASLVAGGPLRDRFAKGTDKLVAALRDKQILRLPSFDVKQVEVTRGGSTPALALQKPALDWKLTAPVAEPAESSEVSDLISTVTNLRAEEFADEASAGSQGASFDRPRATVTLSASAPSTQPSTAPANGAPPATGPAASKLAGGVTVVIGQPVDIEGEKAWVKVSGPAATDPVTIAKVSLNQAAVDKLTKATPLSLRDRRVFTAAADQVSELSITTETPAAGGPATNPSATNPTVGPKTVRLTRRKEHLELGPFLPKGPATNPSATPATQPAAATATPAEAAPAKQPVSSEPPAATPATLPATKPSARLPGLSPLLALTSLLQADPASAAPSPATPATRPLAIVTPSLSTKDELSKLIPTTQPTASPSAATQPATTQPAATTQPSTDQPSAAAPATTAPAATQPATTQPAATAPAAAAHPVLPIEPPKPPSKWVVASAGEADADDAAITALLTDLNPLRAAKYLDKAPPATQPAAATYTVTVKTVAAGGAATTYELHLTDPGGEAKLIGRYNDLTFELDREVLTKLKADFAAKKP